MEEEAPNLVETNAGEEEVNEDELFYETIEAPKYVDLAAPDCYRPGDDRYWFCLRVGCDQKHEEEMDSEAIYKNFILRVMAARSPNVRLRKALCRKDSSSNLKCPKTVPPKLSKLRVSRLALISSISKKLVDPKIKAKPPKLSKLRVSRLALISSISKKLVDPKIKAKPPSEPVMTPYPKLKQSSMAVKCLTAPRNKKQPSNLDAFRSVRKPKMASNAVPSNRVVAKTLVFHSPKKEEKKAKTSMELKTPVNELCSAMKKIQIASVKKIVLGCNLPQPSDAERKQFCGREVKSRVFNGLCSQNHKVVEDEAKSSKCLKKRQNKEKDLQHVTSPAPLARNENDSTIKGIEDKHKNDAGEERVNAEEDDQGSSSEGPLENAAVLMTSSGEDEVDKSSIVNSIENDLSTSSNPRERSSGEVDVLVDLHAPTQHGVETSAKGGEEDISDEDSNNAIEDTENKKYSLTSDDKENASSLDDDRELEVNSSRLKNRTLGRHEVRKDTQKITRVISKLPKKSSATFPTVPRVLKQRKLQLTNPKPFRLRTDERGILKEANLEKELHLAPSKEITSATPGRLAAKKCQSTLRRTETSEASEDEANRPQRDQPENATPKSHVLKEKVGRTLSTVTQRHTVSSQQKLVAARWDKEAQNYGNSLKNARLHVLKRIAKPQDVSTGTKDMAPGHLGVIRETSPTISRPKEDAKGNKVSSDVASEATLKSKTFRINQREPNFPGTHTPKSCVRRVA